MQTSVNEDLLRAIRDAAGRDGRTVPGAAARLLGRPAHLVGRDATALRKRRLIRVTRASPRGWQQWWELTPAGEQRLLASPLA
jgi:hypothetical protein